MYAIENWIQVLWTLQRREEDGMVWGWFVENSGRGREGWSTHMMADVLQYPRSYSTIFQQKKVYFVLWESKQRALYIY
jgi:hypothetical protein